MSRRIAIAAKLTMAVGLLAGLNACATSADPHAMVAASSTDATVKPFPQPFTHIVCINGWGKDESDVGVESR